MQLDPAKYGLVPGHKYDYFSRLLWAAVRLVDEKDGASASKVEAVAYKLDLGIATSQHRKHYQALQHLEDLAEALRMLNLEHPTPCRDLVEKLHSVDKELEKILGAEIVSIAYFPS